MRAGIVAVAGATPFAPIAAQDAARMLNGFDLSGALVPIDATLQGGPPRDGIPAIDQPKFVDADRAGLADDDRVLGLAIGDVQRAYPCAS